MITSAVDGTALLVRLLGFLPRDQGKNLVQGNCVPSTGVNVRHMLSEQTRMRMVMY